MRKIAVFFIGFLIIIMSSCSYGSKLYSSNNKLGWQFVGTTKKTKQLLYLNKKYVKYDKKAKIYKAILKMEPSALQKKKIAEAVKKENKKFEKAFGKKPVNEKNIIKALINSHTAYYIVTTTCKNNTFTIHYPIFNLRVKNKTKTDINIYNFICSGRQ